MTTAVVPFSLRDAPALIERLLPVQKLSAEAYKEQMANVGKTLTALGSYWKGRKPLILNKACILGCLLPATDDAARDLQIFEMLMGMDDLSFVPRSKRQFPPKEILSQVTIARISDYFVVTPPGVLPQSSPVDWAEPEFAKVKVVWREDLPLHKRRSLEAQAQPEGSYRDRVEQARRPEEVLETVHDHIWDEVNIHLGTSAFAMTELVEQLGIMRFGHRPRVADTFCGSGQIPFEAARLGCDVYASDLSPIACMLTWGTFHIVGAQSQNRTRLMRDQRRLIEEVQTKIDEIGIDSDGAGWTAKAFLYCLEVKCPQSDWWVPLIPSFVIGKVNNVIAELIPDQELKRYDIAIRLNVSPDELKAAEQGTVRTEGRGQEPYMLHTIEGIEYRTKISTLRGDHRKADGTNANRLRLWKKDEFKPKTDDIYQERLYCVHWMRPKSARGSEFAHLRGDDYEFRAVTPDDIDRERTVEAYVGDHLAEWQRKGFVPDMRIEPGYNTHQPIRERGWTHWHHLFNPRQLLYLAFIKQSISGSSAELTLLLAKALDFSSRLCHWYSGWEKPEKVFYNQALNTFLNYGCRGWAFLATALDCKLSSFPLPPVDLFVKPQEAANAKEAADVFVTDPPYGDAVNYDEILEFFIAWLRKNPPMEFSEWPWDSRRALAIKGEDEGFRRGMVAAYKRMAECMPDNGIQVVMFTHQSGSIWADMANIVWAAGLQVTAAWYVVTETSSALREGSYVKGTVLLVLRKRAGKHKTTRDDLAWEIQEEVEAQVASLAGLNQEARGLYRDENVFEDADIQMAGYAAALRVLTRYTTIDGRDMTSEAIRPRVGGETTFVDELITFAVNTANQCLVPQGIQRVHWNKLSGAERFYLKMIDMEARGAKTLDNYQNFAKAFKVRNFRVFMADERANKASLKSAVELGRSEMGEGSEFHQSTLRAVLYAIMELEKDLDGNEVAAHLRHNVPDYYNDQTQRERAIEMAAYLAKRLEGIRPEEASSARVLCELLRAQRLG
jgi:putative DNA methylase